jgi:hypothetical protein
MWSRRLGMIRQTRAGQTVGSICGSEPPGRRPAGMDQSQPYAAAHAGIVSAVDPVSCQDRYLYGVHHNLGDR